MELALEMRVTFRLRSCSICELICGHDTRERSCPGGRLFDASGFVSQKSVSRPLSSRIIDIRPAILYCFCRMSSSLIGIHIA